MVLRLDENWRLGAIASVSEIALTDLRDREWNGPVGIRREGGRIPVMVALRLAALWLGLIAPASVPEARGAGGEVISDALEVLDEPDGSGVCSSGELKRRRTRVSVVPGGRPGWLAIVASGGCVRLGRRLGDPGQAADGRRRGRGGSRLAPDGLPPRPGCPALRGPPLAKGAVVRLLDRPALTLGAGARRPGPGGRSPRRPVRSATSAPTGSGSTPCHDLEGPSTRRRRSAPPSTRASTRAAATIRTRRSGSSRRPSERSRRIDHEVTQAQQKLARRPGRSASETTTPRGCSRRRRGKVDGQKVHALIGPEGVPTAYLAIPPGIPASRLLARKVGVRGDVHYNESPRRPPDHRPGPRPPRQGHAEPRRARGVGFNRPGRSRPGRCRRSGDGPRRGPGRP